MLLSAAYLFTQSPELLQSFFFSFHLLPPHLKILSAHDHLRATGRLLVRRAGIVKNWSYRLSVYGEI
jgi:hypothetical protein